jgi:osmotically-inducible protein OsmY
MNKDQPVEIQATLDAAIDRILAGATRRTDAWTVLADIDTGNDEVTRWSVVDIPGDDEFDPELLDEEFVTAERRAQLLKGASPTDEELAQVVEHAPSGYGATGSTQRRAIRDSRGQAASSTALRGKDSTSSSPGRYSRAWKRLGSTWPRTACYSTEQRLPFLLAAR